MRFREPQEQRAVDCGSNLAILHRIQRICTYRKVNVFTVLDLDVDHPTDAGLRGFRLIKRNIYIKSLILNAKKT